jgi:putative transposase
MPRTKYNEEQIIAILKEHAAGATASKLCRIHGMSEATFYNWKARYGVLERLGSRRVKALEDENAKLRMLLADTMLDNATLKDQLGKKW